jgi:hypothetical protein
MLRCEILDKDLARRFEGGVASFDAARARRMQAKGAVRILPEEEGVPSSPASHVAANHGTDYLCRKSFSNARTQKVAWVQDNSKAGGSEISSAEVVRVGELLGFDVVGITPDNFCQSILDGADFAVVNNVFEFDPDQMDRIRFFLYERRLPYIKYEHDYRELGRLNLSQQMFWLSRANIFISPAHMERHVEGLGIDPKLSICLPLAIDVNLFAAVEGIERVSGSVLVPCWRKCKDRVAEFIEKNDQYSYSILGQADRAFPDRKVRHVAAGPVGMMPGLYSAHEFVLHLPVERWAGERVFFESMLCGCKLLIDNEKVGHASWCFKPEEMRDRLRLAPYQFWDQVCRLLRN